MDEDYVDSYTYIYPEESNYYRQDCDKNKKQDLTMHLYPQT